MKKTSFLSLFVLTALSFTLPQAMAADLPEGLLVTTAPSGPSLSLRPAKSPPRPGPRSCCVVASAGA
ncbi:hypothetical protein [Verrucomicrobium spinosum]|uniref:hypothetical protein n=1 Tax=Verrucomicrobium spinosum TaxID=2736 RepID=UPI000A41C91B|nr:hypothetical protein [Verrucomicrobium spinosum]